MSNYDHRLLKSYKHWGLYLHENQFPYIGRCYAAAVRDGADVVTDMSVEERDELFDIVVPEWKTAVNTIYPFDRENLAILGNTSAFLHAHLIPRRKENFTYAGIDFIDPNPTGNYAPYERRELAPEIMQQIMDDMWTVLRSTSSIAE